MRAAGHQVPWLDLQARLRPLRAELVAACERVIDSGVYVMGPEAEALEHEFAAYSGAKHGIAVANGTVALQLALLAANIGPGDEVISVSHTFIATVEAITAVGAKPVLVDVSPDTYTIDVAQAEAAITPRTKAIIAVHLYGLPADMDQLRALADKHGLLLVEDAAQAHGARYRGRRAGSLGDVACFSLYPSKNLGTLGEGGIILTSDGGLATRMRALRSHGEVDRYASQEPGYNFRMPELMAAMARVQLPHLDAWNAERRQVGAWYAEALAGLPVVIPHVPADREHVYHLYVVQTERRDAVRQALSERGVGTAVHYPLAVHQQQAYRSLGVSLPETERLAARVLSLPMYPNLSQDDVMYVGEALRAALEASKALVA